MGSPELAPPPRQRWRIVFRRLPDAPALGQREWTAAWEAAFTACGLPLARAERGPAGRPKLSFGPPLAVGMPAERELVDVFLLETLPVAVVREALSGAVPEGHELVDVHDAWVGEPALQAQVVGLVYRIDIELPAGSDAGPVAAACRSLLAAAALPRRRRKGDGDVAYDLRPLVDYVEVLPSLEVVRSEVPESAPAEARACVRARLRVDPELGIGRPEEVIAALGDALGVELAVRAIVRESVVLSGDVDDGRLRGVADSPGD